MPPFKVSRRFAALLMLVVLLTIVGRASYAPQGERYGLTSGTASVVDFGAVDTASPAGSHADHKPPKHSFTDYDAMFASYHPVPAYPPCTSFHTHRRPAPLPDVYHDIDVPPQNRA